MDGNGFELRTQECIREQIRTTEPLRKREIPRRSLLQSIQIPIHAPEIHLPPIYHRR